MGEKPIYDEAAKAKLYADLPGKVELALERGRPMLHHLNGDTSWLYQLPLSPAAQKQLGGKKWFNILIDPWFVGPGTTLHRLFIVITHTILPAISTVDEVGDLCAEVDRLSGGPQPPSNPQLLIDLVLCTNSGPDHTNPETLRTIHPSIPISAGQRAAATIKALNHFDTVYSLGLWTGMGPTGGDTTVPLPHGIEISELADPKGGTALLEVALFLRWLDPAGLSGALSEAHEIEESGSQWHGLIHVPHGLLPTYCAPKATPALASELSTSSSQETLEILALLAGTQYSDLSLWNWLRIFMTNHGTDAGFAAVARTGAARYVATHDEAFDYLGFNSYIIRRLADKGFDEARAEAVARLEAELEAERAEESEPMQGKHTGDDRVQEQLRRVRKVHCIRPEVGETIVLA